MVRVALLTVACCAALAAGCERDSGAKEMPRIARRQADPEEGSFRNLGKRAASSLEAGAAHETATH